MAINSSAPRRYPKLTMRNFDPSTLTRVKPLSGASIKQIRKKAGVTQKTLAQHLCVEAKEISQWERGKSKPCSASLKLLTLVAKNGLRWIA